MDTRSLNSIFMYSLGHLPNLVPVNRYSLSLVLNICAHTQHSYTYILTRYLLQSSNTQVILATYTTPFSLKAHSILICNIVFYLHPSTLSVTNYPCTQLVTRIANILTHRYMYNGVLIGHPINTHALRY